MTELDILAVDSSIRESFNSEKKNLDQYKKTFAELDRLLKSKNLSMQSKCRIEKNHHTLQERIKNIENDTDYNFYIRESIACIESYKKILNTPQKISFVGKSNENNSQKIEIITKFLSIAQKYVSIDIEIPDPKKKIYCSNCDNKKEFIISDNNVYICILCGAEQKIPIHTSSYKDIDRVNISTKYTYDRIIHFRDCMNQYQGKQNSTIDIKVYQDLERQFELHHLLVDSSDKQKRFSKITHEHINMFLKELEYTKHYENINLIHYNFTKIPPDDISYLEDVLMDDFIILTELYDKRFKIEKKIDRKNFINTQYVLFQLLCRHKHPCKKDDFNILKTTDRQAFHDEICKELFTELGWNHTPFL
jgi:hypothetical protein